MQLLYRFTLYKNVLTERKIGIREYKKERGKEVENKYIKH